MTCKDCIHYDLCIKGTCDEHFTEETPQKIRDMFSPLGCETFKNKADYAEVKHGEWIIQTKIVGVKEYFRGTCSICGRTVARICEKDIFELPYCHCGAKMDGKGDT